MNVSIETLNVVLNLDANFAEGSVRTSNSKLDKRLFLCHPLDLFINSFECDCIPFTYSLASVRDLHKKYIVAINLKDGKYVCHK